MKRLVLALAILLASAIPVGAQQDEQGCKDHPLFARLPNFQISACETQASDSFEFERREGPAKIEGQYWKIDYWVRDDAQEPQPVQILQRYWSRAASRGATKLLERLDSDGGILTARIPGTRTSGTTWLEVYVTMGGECYSLTIVQEKRKP